MLDHLSTVYCDQELAFVLFRYVEHKFELDSIKTTAEKMQAALDDTHRALHAEAARRMALEEVAAMANIEAARAKELAAAIAAER